MSFSLVENSMDGSVSKPKLRYVRCPRCRNILPEAVDVPVYQCGVCNTMLRVKHWKGGGQTGIPLQTALENRSENGVPCAKGKSITLSDNAMCKTTDVGRTSNSDNGCSLTAENSENGANQNGIAHETINWPDEHVKENINIEATPNLTALGEISNPHDGYHVNRVNSENEGNSAHGKQALTCTTDHIERNPTSEISAKGGSEKEDGDEATNYLGERMKRKLSEDDACNSTDVEKTSNSDDRCDVTREKSEEKETTKEHGDEAINYVTLAKFMEENLNLGRDNPGKVKAEVKKDQLTEPSDKKILLVENLMINEDTNSGTGNFLMSPDDSTSLAYEGSISSFGDRGDDLDGLEFRPSPKETFRAPDISETKTSTSQWREEMSPTQELLQEMNLDQEPSNKTSGSEKITSFDSDNFEQASKYDGIYAPGREISSVSDQFPTHKFENCESFSSHRFSENNIEQYQMELLRKVDQLRCQILGSLDRRSGLYETPQLTGRRRARRVQAPLLGIQELEVDVLENSLSALRSRRQQLPTGEANPYCSHCHALPPPGIFCNNGLCMSCYRMLRHHSSSSADFQYHRVVSNARLASSSSLSLDYEPVKKQSKVKDQTTKRHIRPILGGANFIICYECLQLLQIPDDLQVSRCRINKVCCGACSKVIRFSFSNDLNLMGRRESQVSCYSEDYGTPSTRGSVFPRNHIDSTGETDGSKAATLHRLMGYCSARDIIYQPSDEDDFY